MALLYPFAGATLFTIRLEPISLLFDWVRQQGRILAPRGQVVPFLFCLYLVDVKASVPVLEEALQEGGEGEDAPGKAGMERAEIRWI